MHHITKIAKDIYYLGGNDRRIALFESAYPVPRGVSYNTYLIADEKTVLLDTADLAVSEFFLENLRHALGGRELDYLVVHHMEPDHSAVFSRVTELYPGAVVVANRKTADMLRNYYGFPQERVRIVAEGDALPLGKRTLKFVFAPMVHWPEVMFSYVPEDGILFSADAFGTFGALGGRLFASWETFEREDLDDARRYYFNIVGKYGAQVQNALKKAAGLPISLVCPLHGPIWRGEEFGRFLEKYDIWSKYLPEERCAAVFYASVYGHTQNAAEIVAREIGAAGVPVRTYDVSVTHGSVLLAEAFRSSHLVFASTTYNNGIFPSMEQLLSELKAHGFRGRKYSLIENGSWAPQSGALMSAEIGAWKDMAKLGDTVTVLSAVNDASAAALKALAACIVADIKEETGA